MTEMFHTLLEIPLVLKELTCSLPLDNLNNLKMQTFSYHYTSYTAQLISAHLDQYLLC